MEVRIDIDIALWLVEQLSMYEEEEEAGGMATVSESGQIARSEKGVLKAYIGVLFKGDGARREGEKGDERGWWAKLNGGLNVVLLFVSCGHRYI